MTNTHFILRQMFEHESSTYTYLIFDPISKEGIIIDPVLETLERDLNLINELNVKLKYVLDTHLHADHVTGAGKLRQATGAKTAIGEHAQVACVDIHLKNEQELTFGPFSIKAISTPGHTNGCTSYIFQNMVFTGDTLLIRGNGRTDFQEGSAEKLYFSITEKLFTLPRETIVYPAHNYVGLSASSIGEEIDLNPRIGNGKKLEEFVVIMNNLDLPKPKKINLAVPANQKCGLIKNVD